MKFLTYAVIVVFMIAGAGSVCARDVEEGESRGSSNAGGQILGGALMGGLLGGGIGAAIGSASGHAGTGAAIGAGVGALGGSVVGASNADRERQREIDAGEDEDMVEDDVRAKTSEQAVPAGAKVKKRVIREYDEMGNVVSEKEVKE